MEFTNEQIDEHLLAVLGEEEFEQLDELSKSTLKSYVKKATKSSDRAWAKADKEEDKAMSTDGNKYPEKQKRHMDASNKEIATWNKRRKGLENAGKRLTKESIEEMIASAYENKPVEFEAAFGAAMHAAVMDRIDALRPEVAAGMFGSKE